MAAIRGWEPEPTLSDALAGSGGMADPVAPIFTGTLAADYFPDALSVSPLPWVAVSSPPWARTAAGPPAPPLIPPPASSAGRGPAPTGRPVPPRAGRQAPPTGPRVPLAPPAGSRQVPVSPRPWSQLPPPGTPATQYVPAPTSAQLAPGTGRRPVAGVDFPAATPRPIGPVAPITRVRPPAYLPQNPGLTQIRAAIAQARQSSGRSSVRSASGPPTSVWSASGRSGPSASVPPVRRKKASGAWGFLVVLLIVLVSSGLGQKIINAISELLQRK